MPDMAIRAVARASAVATPCLAAQIRLSAAARLLPSASAVAREPAHLLDAEDLLPDGGVGPVRPARSHQAFPSGGGVYQGSGLSIFRGLRRQPQGRR